MICRVPAHRAHRSNACDDKEQSLTQRHPADLMTTCAETISEKGTCYTDVSRYVNASYILSGAEVESHTGASPT